MRVEEKDLPGALGLLKLTFLSLFVGGYVAPFLVGILYSSGEPGGSARAAYGMLTVLFEFGYWQSLDTYLVGFFCLIFSACHAAYRSQSHSESVHTKWFQDYFFGSIACIATYVGYLIMTTPGGASLSEAVALILFYGLPILMTFACMGVIWRSNVQR